ncbi:hypothetical protein AMELA_G00018570 [Ameiurus melas]|uniref:Uncharacterized protein n=1 Tax=Ameiurus melas TaxID=219545 RepID=A0A7J6BCL4_AMEME|nr:hypothetical protein AMELA_G00018570 [Ameiurus melas]
MIFLLAACIKFKTMMLIYKARNGPAPHQHESCSAPCSLQASSTAQLDPPSIKGTRVKPNQKSSFTHVSGFSPRLEGWNKKGVFLEEEEEEEEEVEEGSSTRKMKHRERNEMKSLSKWHI